MFTKLWYKTPAASFCSALPIGNGSLGAIVYGNVPEEYMTLNLDTLWSGTGLRQERRIDRRIFDRAKELCRSRSFFEAQQLIEGQMLGKYNESYMPLGILRYRYINVADYREYKRALDLETGMITTDFTAGGKKYHSEIFSSYPAKAMILKLTCDDPAGLHVQFTLESKLAHFLAEYGGDGMMMTGNAPSHVEPNYVASDDPIVYEYKNMGMPFCCYLKIGYTDGRIYYQNGMLTVENASEIQLHLTAADGYRKETGKIDASAEHCAMCCEKVMGEMKRKKYEDILAEHLLDHTGLFHKSRLWLDSGTEPELPLDGRLKAFKNGAKDDGLYSLYYHFNRYLLIASSREGSQPANLQGIWSAGIRPVWSSNWTININTEMNYWPAGICNLTECYEPLLVMLEQMSESGAKTAANYYGCRGWAANHNVDLWRQTEPVAGDAKYAYWPMGGVWLSAQIYDYYSYTGDTDLLKNRIYPIMTGAARFCIDWMEQDADGYFHTPISTSPENTFLDEQGRVCAVSVSSTMDVALIRELFQKVIKAAGVLDIEDEFLQEVKHTVKRMPEYQIGKYGQLQEWIEDFEEPEPGHRHFSGLAGFHPGTTINQYETPELICAVKSLIERRLKHGGGHTGWSCAWLMNLYARLNDGNRALHFLDHLLKQSSYDNLFDLHPPLGNGFGEREVFQIDGNFGAASGIASLFVRSCYGRIELLPALPDAWRSGRITGLLCEGAVAVDLEWTECQLKKAVLRSDIDQDVIVSYQGKEQRVKLDAEASCELEI